MILGFAHITKNGGEYAFAKGHVPSAPEKWPLMVRHATSHNLFMGAEGAVPVEVVVHDTGVVEWP